MAKKEQPLNEPKVSNIPLPASENSLVIDLPDGQKLVVGNLDSGSVIEVATWRGTGRPDSRTNRLMLGMSTTQAFEPKAEAAKANQVQPENAQSQLPKKSELKVPGIGKIKVPNLNVSHLRIPGLKSIWAYVGKVRNSLLSKSQELAPVESVGDLDIENWLASIKQEASAKAAIEKPRTPAAKTTSPKKSAPKAPVKKKSAKKGAQK